MAKLYNLARMTTATVGTGTITLGAAVSGYLTFALAGVANSDVVDYAIKDGSNSEIGTGTYTSSGTTLTRTVTKSTNGNAAISLSGTAEVFISPRAESILSFDAAQTFTQTQMDKARDNLGVSFFGTLVARNLGLGPGAQAVVGIGFKPRAIIFTTGISGGSAWTSTGYVTASSQNCIEYQMNGVSAFFQNGFAGIQRDDSAGSNYQTFTVSSFDADGFTLSWVKNGSPTATALISAVCMR